MPRSNEDGLLDLVSKIVENMSESQSSNAEVLAGFKSAIEELRKDNEKIKETAEKIESEFRNGFRKELKEHIDVNIACVCDDVKQNIKEEAEAAKKEILESILEFKKWSFWAKLIMASFISLAGLVVAIYKLVELIATKI